MATLTPAPSGPVGGVKITIEVAETATHEAGSAETTITINTLLAANLRFTAATVNTLAVGGTHSFAATRLGSGGDHLQRLRHCPGQH